MAAESPAYSASLREQAREEAARIRARLTLGDFQRGDQVVLTVEGHPPYSGTFTVVEGPSLVIPVLGTVALNGVLRSEAERHIADFVRRFVKEPTVQVRTQIRITIIGAVTTAGFHTVETDAVVTDALSKAGTLLPTAKLDGIHVLRDGKRLWSDAAFQQAINEARTLDQIGLRTGDQIVVPSQSQKMRTAEGTFRVIGLLLTIPVTIYGLIRLF
jgi:polysaccharide export outer membrane protein